VADMSKALRTGKVFIDWSQNYPTKTTVGVYSLRAKHPQPFVSMPVRWEELKDALRVKSPNSLYFSPEAALARIKKHGDLFASVLKLKQRLPQNFIELLPARTMPRHLQPYGARRDFSRTSEPEPVLRQRSAQGSRRRFVVQMHAAQHLHYDFRLELQDVLKSWAVPKGIPLQEGERHSAFATEDHPLDYLEFEGIIPKGQYGGGTVMVWDIGTYDRVNGNYYSGEFTVHLTGRKLKGEWTLRRIRTEGKSADKPVWLLLKTTGTAPPIPAARKDLSALTNRTMQEIAAEKSAVWNSNRIPARPKAKTRSNEQKASAVVPAPEFVAPMKATLVDTLPEGPEWIYEVKWDGYRALALKHNATVRLLSLKNKDLAADFPSVVAAVRTLPAATALLDGEIVAIDGTGKPSFQALQNRRSVGKNWQIVYYAFDLLTLAGKDLKLEPLERRRARLKDLLENSGIRFSAELPGSAEQVIPAVKNAGLEGIVAKRRNSSYLTRTRSRDWRKLKLSPAQEFVVGGYNPEGATFSSLLVGYYEGRNLMFAGKVRQGLNPASRRALMRTFSARLVDECPFANLPISKTGHFGEGITAADMQKLHWVRPELVVQVSFTEWTSYGLLRHATFEGLRNDKNAHEVVRESVDPVKPAFKPKT
jgi:bifunctional non-homologous end joining protein LigD